MFRQVILNLSSVKKDINITHRPKPTIPTSLYEVNIRSLKNIVESIRRIKKQ